MRNMTTGEGWADRHLCDGEDWIESYWKSRDHPHRSFLVERICKFSPLRSILEIGCASGPNLYNIAMKFPDAKIRGVDINPVAVQKGNEWLKKEGISNVKLEVGRAQELGRFADKSFDVVFTDATLIYISPVEIKQVIKEMLRLSRVLVLNEWHSSNKSLTWFSEMHYSLRQKFEKHFLSKERSRTLGISFKPRSASLGLFVGHWVRDYKTLLGEFVPPRKIHITKLPKELWNDKNWQRWGAIIEVWG
jgi:SAM-dependent methyltransferase